MLITFKKIFTQLNIFSQCKKYRLSFWQCPQFLFIIMGVVIIVSILITYALATRYIIDPQIIVIIIAILTIVLFIITFSITQTLEYLAKANQMKSEFINIASHQLRTPITNFKWILDFLISEKELKKINKKQIEYFHALKENTCRMEKLVSDLLNVSRIEQGNFSFNRIKFFLEPLVQETILNLKPLIKSSNTKIRLKIEGSPPKSFGDSDRIKFVIKSFIKNAIYYSNSIDINKIKKKKIIDIKIKKTLRGLVFEVTDTGVGISKEDKGRIFQKFFRAKNIFKYKTQGLGLSLYISKFIIEKSGGKIGFTSKKDEGSTFWFILPTK